MHRHNPSGQSSKADIVESLLRLGDIARNEQVGEVQTALGKAKMLIDKYGLIQFDGRYQQLVEKVAAFMRGERVHRDEEPGRQQHQQSSGRTDDPFGGYSYSRRAREQAWRREKEAHRDARRDARRRAKAEARAQRKAEQRTQRAEAKRDYHRPRKSDRIVWLWKLPYSPKRGKAGERWKAYYPAETIGEMLDRGGRWSDVKWNIQHGYMRVEE